MQDARGNLRRTLIVREIDNETLSRAKNIFDDYKLRGVVLNSSFNDPGVDTKHWSL